MATVNNLSQITGNTVVQDAAAIDTIAGWSLVNGTSGSPSNGFTAVGNEFDFFIRRTATSFPTFSIGQDLELEFRITGSASNFGRGIYFQPWGTTRVTVQQVNPVSGSSLTIRVRTTNSDDLGNDFTPTDGNDPSLNSANESLGPAGNRDSFGITVRTGVYGQITNNASNVFTNSNIQFTSPNLPGSGSILSLDANGRLTRASIAGLTFRTETDLTTNELPVEFNVSPDGLTVEALVDTTGIATTISDLDTSLNAEIDALAFTSLTDTPNSLGSAGQEIRVNSAGNALEFFTQSHTDDNYFFIGGGLSGSIGLITPGTTATIRTDASSDRIPSSWRVGSLGNVRTGVNFQNFRVTAINLFGAERTSMDVVFGPGQGGTSLFSSFDVAQGNLDTDTTVTLQAPNAGSTTGYTNLEVDLTIDPVAGSANTFDVSASADISALRGERFFGVASGSGINPNSLQDSAGFNTTLQVSSGIRGYDWRANQWGFGITELASAVPYVFTFRVISVSGIDTAPTLNIRVTKFNSVGTIGNVPQSFYIFQGQPNPTRFLNNPATTTNTVPVIFTENHEEGTISATANVESVISQITASASSAAISVFEETTQIASLVNTMRFSGAGVTASETNTGDITITVPESGDFFHHRFDRTIDLSTNPTIVEFPGLPEGSDWQAGDKGYARSTNGQDEFRFTVQAVITTGTGIFRVSVDTLTLVSGSVQTSWDVDAGPIETRFDTASAGTNERAVTFARDTTGAVTGVINTAGLGGGGTGGVVWPFQSGTGNTSPERITFNQNEWQPGDEPTLTLTGEANTGWAEEQYGQLVGSTRNGNTTTIQAVINFRVRTASVVGSDTVLGVEVIDNLLFTQASLFMNWGIYPGLASFDAAGSGSAYTDLDTRFWNTASIAGNEGFNDDRATGLFGRTNVDNSASPPVAAAPGQSVHFSEVESDLGWVLGQFGYARHYTGNALFTFEVQEYSSATNTFAIEIVDIIRNTLGQFANRTSTIESMNLNRWAIFAGSPTPEVMLGTDDAFPIEIYGDLDSTVEVENVEATSVATRIVFDEDDFELHLGAEAAGAAVTYQALTAPAAGGFGPQVVTDIYSGSVNAVQTGGFLNIQLGLQGAGLAVGGTANVGNLDRTQASPAINNASGLILAFNRRDLDNTLTEDDFVEVVTVRNDTDSNGNRARIRTDLVDAANFSAADYIALGTNVPLYFRSTGGSTTPDPNQVIVRAKAQQTDPLILQGRNAADDANEGSSITDAIQLNVVAPLEVSSAGTTATLTVDTLSTRRSTGNVILNTNTVNNIEEGFTGTIPSNPLDGDTIIVKNVGETLGDIVFVSPISASTTIDGSSTSLRLNRLETIELVYAENGIEGTAGWVTVNRYSPTYATRYVQSFTNSTTWVVDHNLGLSRPLVQVYDSSGSSVVMIIPDEITINNNNRLTITFNANVTGDAVVVG